MRMLLTQVSIVGKTTKAVGTGVVQGTKVGFLQQSPTSPKIHVNFFLVLFYVLFQNKTSSKTIDEIHYLMVTYLSGK